MTVKARIDPSDEAGQIINLQRSSDARNGAYTALANAAGQTLTAAQMVGALLARSGAAGVSDTTPTATQILAAMPGAAVGDSFNFEIRNTNTGTLTIVAGTGVTLEGTTTVATVSWRKYKGVVTAVGTPAVTLHGIATALV